MRRGVVRETVAVALLLGAVLVGVALATHSPLDPSPFHASTDRDRPANLAGWLGATLSAAFLNLVGLTAFLLPVIALVLGWRLLRERLPEHPRLLAAGWTLVVLFLPGLVQLVVPELPLRGGSVPGGGLIGLVEAEALGRFAGPVGRVVILLFCLVAGLLLLTGASLGGGVDRLSERLRQRWLGWRRERLRRRREREQLRDQRKVLTRQLERMAGDEYRGPVTVKEVEGRGRFRIVRRCVEPAAEPASTPTSGGATSSARRRRPSTPAPPPPTEPLLQEEFDFVEDLDSYDLPKAGFLDGAEAAPERDTSQLIEMSKLITEKCREFKVGGEVVNIRTGPVITTYEFRLEAGVKISAVQNLAEDLALALRTEAVRIERIPGRATVGIEVPSPTPETIRLKELIEAPEFERAQGLLTVILGVDIRGKPFVADLARMPHLLIGGFTGAGKSVGINAMIMSILYRARPDAVKFILVDPKMVELGVYENIPQLLTPIINDPKKAANALAWAVDEMDRRYRLLASLGVRNLDQYNQLVRDPVQLKRAIAQRGEGFEPEDLEPLPFIVIIIDELADLMIASSRAVEEAITRLAQKARAVGVHLICATQRPSVDIITGIIKANFPCRIAYKVRSKHDSRTILDAIGAEHLLGRGDMLFLPPGTSHLIRLHGPLVTEKEIATVVRYIKRFGKPEYRRDVLSHAPLAPETKTGRGGAGRATVVEDESELDDPMYGQAARLVVETRKASASYVQRRLHLGYTRSARLLDMMEKEGLVGPLRGSRGREVLVPENHFEEVDETRLLSDGDLEDVP